MPHEFIDKLNNEISAFDLSDDTLRDILITLEEMSSCIKKFQDQPKNKALTADQNDQFLTWLLNDKNITEITLEDLEKEIIDILLKLEKEAKIQKKPWRVVIDFPIYDEVYKPPLVQICNGHPSYNRCVIEFEKTPPELRIAANCIEKEPELRTIRGGASPTQKDLITLADTKRHYDEAGMQRIAILGKARIFPYIETSGSDIIKVRQAIGYTANAQRQLDAFLTTMDANGDEYSTVNGGWAGRNENSMGMTMISNLFGAVHSGEQSGFHPPITVMPRQANYDRVKTMADYLEELEQREISVSISEEERAAAAATYFETPGVWGDDSKYLVGISSSLLVFDPRGTWTDIEIANGLAQDKPVAIIADPAKLSKGEYGGAWSTDTKFWEEKPGLRVYKNASDAAEWLNETWQAKLRGEQSIDQHHHHAESMKSTHQCWMRNAEKVSPTQYETENRQYGSTEPSQPSM
jgi:hypothetical protein